MNGDTQEIILYDSHRVPVQDYIIYFDDVLSTLVYLKGIWCEIRYDTLPVITPGIKIYLSNILWACHASLTKLRIIMPMSV